MAGTAFFSFMAELVSASRGRQRVPPDGMLQLARAVDELSVFPILELANGASNVPIPGIGPGSTEVGTIQLFGLLAYGPIMFTWQGGFPTPYNGTAARPALFIAFETSITVVPTVSNSSGATVDLLVFYGGT